MTSIRSILVALLILVTLPPLRSQACPFCNATAQTLSEEIAGADVAVLARLVREAPETDFDALPPEDGDAAQPDLGPPLTGTARFAIETVLHGEELLQGQSEIEVVYFGGDDAAKTFLISGIASNRITGKEADANRADWTTPLPLSAAGVEYIRQLVALSTTAPERCEFFIRHFEHSDPLVAQDAYDEFARIPYAEIEAVADRLDREQLLGWIEDPEVGPSRRRLYLTLLGICGTSVDAERLESLLQYDYRLMQPALATAAAAMASQGVALAMPTVVEQTKADVNRKQQCLDALIAAYLKLKGPAGLPLVERLFITNPAVEYPEVYATIMALRFHGEETKVIPLPRLLETMRLFLDNEEIADQVVTDLARWGDWSVLDRLVAMFKASSPDGWIRQPVISYLVAAADEPDPVGSQANAALGELEKIDPEGVKRAQSYLAFGAMANRGSAARTAANEQSAAPSEIIITDEGPVLPPESPAPVTLNVEKAPSTNGAEQEVATPSTTMMVGVPVIACILLFGLFSLLLRSGDVRSVPSAYSPGKETPSHDPLD